jgi:hypothetical protein
MPVADEQDQNVAWGQEVDATPVLAGDAQPVPREASSLARRSAGAVLPAAATAAAVAGGFVAGAAVFGLVARRHGRSPALARGRAAGRRLGRRGRSAPAPQMLQVLSTRSLLVDVHVLGPAGPAR